MKDKILMLIIGILIGAIIASACFLLFSNTNNRNGGGMGDRPGMNQNMMDEGMGRPGRDGNSLQEPPDMTDENAESISNTDEV